MTAFKAVLSVCKLVCLLSWARVQTIESPRGFHILFMFNRTSTMTRFTSHLYGLNIPIKEVKLWENIWEAMPYLNVMGRRMTYRHRRRYHIQNQIDHIRYHYHHDQITIQILNVFSTKMCRLVWDIMNVHISPPKAACFPKCPQSYHVSIDYSVRINQSHEDFKKKNERRHLLELMYFAVNQNLHNFPISIFLSYC